MSKLNNDLWLFNYNQGAAYEEFSKSEDVFRAINTYLFDNYNFKDKTILEIGAGSGKFTSLLSKMCSKLYAVERSTSLMQINRNKNRDVDNVEFILSDIRELAMKPNSIDVIFAGWSMTSMRESFNIVFEIFRKILRKDGMILLVENAGNDEFSKVMGIENFTSEMENAYVSMGFIKRMVVDTIIRLPCEDVFYNAFPNKNNVKLSSLDIQHKVLILEMHTFGSMESENHQLKEEEK